MKVVSSEGLTKLIQLSKDTFVDKTNLATVATSGNYNDLSNKPTIPTVNNATLTIQKNNSNVATFTANASSNVTANISVPTKTSDLTNDSGYTSNTGTVTSVNNISPVNGNVTISIPTVDQSYSGTSANAQSGVAVKSAIDSAISSVYKAAGSVAYASLPTPSSSNEGNVYNVTDAFTTDSRFVEGSGNNYPAGTNVVIINTTGTTYKFDILAGMVDLSGYVPTTRTVNGKALSGNISLTASDVSAIASADLKTSKYTAADANTKVYAASYINSALNGKQATIDDLDTIRSNAASGATALQADALNNTHLTGNTTAQNLAVSGTLTQNGYTVLTTASELSGSKLATSSVTKNKLANSVQDSLDKADNVAATIASYGNIVTHNVSEFATAAQGAKAATALQQSALTDTQLIGDTKAQNLAVSGSLTQNGNHVLTTASELAGSKLTAGSVSKLKLNTDVQTSLNKAENAIQSVSIATGANNGQVALTVDGTTTQASVKGLATVATSGSYNDLSNKPTIPGIATTSTAGLVKPDGTTITVDANGTISSASSVDIDEETITENSDNELQVVAVKNKLDDSTLGIWHGTEYQWNHGDPTTWYYWQTSVTASWTSGGNLPSNKSWVSVFYGNQRFIAFAWLSDTTIYSDDNGATWQSGGTLPYRADDTMIPITVDNKIIIINSDYSKTIYSDDNGATWQSGGSFGSTGWNSPAYGNGRIVLTNKYNNTTIYSDDKGDTWQSGGTLPLSEGWRAAAYGNGRFITIKTGKKSTAYSDDGGITWQAGGDLLTETDWSIPVYNNGRFLTLPWLSGRTNYSDDNGITWQSGGALPDNYWLKPVCTNDVILAISKTSNKSAYSMDNGNTWVTSLLPSSSWRNPAYGNGRFVSVRYSSTDSAIFTVQYDKCYTDTANPTTTSVVYSAPETVSSYTISSVTSGAITLSNNNTYYYNQSGNQYTYQTIGDAHPEYLAFIDGVGIKKGNTLIASCGLTQVNYNSTGKTLTIE